MKKLAMLLALCLLAASMPLNALAEDIENACQEAPVGETMGETGAPGLMAEPEDPANADAADGADWLDGDEVFAQPEDWAVLALPEEETPVSPESEQQAEATAEAQAETGGEATQPEEAQSETAQEPAVPHTDADGPQLTANELTLGVGESFALKPALPEGKAGVVTCAVDSEAVATVTAEGTVKAVAVGETIVTATCDDGTYAECFVHVKQAPDKVRFVAQKFRLGLGETTDALKVVVGSAEDKFAGAYKVTSNRQKIVRVNADGTIKGLKKGTATLTVKTYNGKKATCKVTVVNAPKKLAASVDKGTIGVGETAQITCKLPDGTASQILYKSLAPDVATVDPATGVVTGVAPGSARIMARTFNKHKKYITVKVLPAPQALTFADQKIALGVGMKLNVAAAVDDGAAGNITYKVKHKTIAAYKDGVLKGVKRGKTVLTATTYNGLSAKCVIYVVAAPKSVKLPDSTLTIGVRQSVQLKPDVGKSVSTYTYESSNKKVVAVDAQGLLKGLKTGTATVTVRTYNDKKAVVKVTVLKAPGSIALKPKKVELGIGESADIAFTLPKNTAAAVTYAIKDESVATLDAASGQLTGVAPGETVMTVVTHNGKKAKATVKVYDRPEWIEPDTGLIELSEGQTHELEITFSPDSRSPLTFTSDDPDVATVSDTGVITAVGGGTTTIHVGTNAPEVTCSVSVTVWPAPRKVAFKKTKMSLDIGDTAQLEPVITKDSVTTFTYSTSDENVADVSKDGIVTAISRGTATITVETHNGKTANLALTVVDPWYPESIAVSNAPEYMKSNSTCQLELAVKPATAIPDLKWSTTDESIAWVDDDDVIHTSGFGYVVLSAVSRKNPDLRIELTLAVETDNVTLVIPARTTSISGISENLAKIDAIRTSAINQIKALYAGGVISKDDASKRASIVNNAFEDYAFPWMTPKYQDYWKAANSENGAKDFKPDRVYYGLPYISGSGSNREYNAEKALREARYTDSGKGYYLLNQNNLRGGKYCGNDCSCFVDAAIWGTNSGHSNDRTAEIATSSAYKSVGSFKSLRPGDLICKGYAHVVMFLYYANADKSQIMIIENGGIEPGTNTVHCMIMDIDYYDDRNYKPLRLRGID